MGCFVEYVTDKILKREKLISTAGFGGRHNRALVVGFELSFCESLVSYD